MYQKSLQMQTFNQYHDVFVGNKIDSSGVYQLCRLMFQFTSLCTSADIGVILVNGKTSELTHLHILNEKIQIRFYEILTIF